MFSSFSTTSFVHCGKCGSPRLGKAQPPKEQRYPFLSGCVVFSCVKTMVWLPVLGIFNERTNIDASDWARGLYECVHQRECALEVDPERKIPCRTVFSRTRYQLSSRPAISGGLSWGELMQFRPNFTFSVLDNKTVSTSPSRHIRSVQGPVGLEPVELAS